jgi:hypothetical protein
MEFFDWRIRYLIEMDWESGKVWFGLYSMLSTKLPVIHMLCVSMRQELQ